MNRIPAKVMCVERKASRTDALQDMVNRMENTEWAGVIAERESIASEASDRDADIVLLDIDLLGSNPFEAVESLRHRNPSVRSIVYSRHVKRDAVEKAFAAGAWGFVSKREGAAAIAAAITRVMRDEYVMGPDVEAAFMKLTPG